jgi:hypothetical protein
METLWDANRADELLGRAAAVVEKAAAGNFNRDDIRTEPFTSKVIEYCQQEVASPHPTGTTSESK